MSGGTQAHAVTEKPARWMQRSRQRPFALGPGGRAVLEQQRGQQARRCALPSGGEKSQPSREAQSCPGERAPPSAPGTGPSRVLPSGGSSRNSPWLHREKESFTSLIPSSSTPVRMAREGEQGLDGCCLRESGVDLVLSKRTQKK